MSLEEMIARYGYLALFAGVIIEGEAMLVAASFAAHQGYLQLPWVIVVAFLGSLVGDEFYFFFGRTKGKHYLQRHPSLQLKVRKVQKLLERHHRLAIVVSRFLYGLRSIAPFSIGMSGINTKSFLILNAFSALAWAVLFGGFGFLFGTLLENLASDIRHHERSVLLSIVTIGAIVWTVSHFRTARLRGTRKGGRS